MWSLLEPIVLMWEIFRSPYCLFLPSLPVSLQSKSQDSLKTRLVIIKQLLPRSVHTQLPIKYITHMSAMNEHLRDSQITGSIKSWQHQRYQNMHSSGIEASHTNPLTGFSEDISGTWLSAENHLLFRVTVKRLNSLECRDFLQRSSRIKKKDFYPVEWGNFF